MADTNTITIEGNLTRDPEVRFSQAGNPVINTGLAWSQNKRTPNGDWESVPHFFDVTIFGEHGEHVAESLAKGTRVIVVGRLDYSTWTNDQGDKRSKVAILAESISPSLRWATASVSRVAKTNGDAPKTTTATPAPVVDEEPF